MHTLFLRAPAAAVVFPGQQQPLSATSHVVPRHTLCRSSRLVCTASKGFGGKAAVNQVGVQKKDECPCGSGQAFTQCCGQYHAGAVEPNAEAVLRARYTAYVLGGGALKYIVDSTHARSPDMKRVEGDVESVARAQLLKDAGNTHKNLAFTKLSVVSAERGGTEQEHWVTFRATYKERKLETEPKSKGGNLWRDDKVAVKVLAQRARFLQDQSTSRWQYFGGTVLTPGGLGSYGDDRPASMPTGAAATS